MIFLVQKYELLKEKQLSFITLIINPIIFCTFMAWKILNHTK
jgi:hypothetical protein